MLFIKPLGLIFIFCCWYVSVSGQTEGRDITINSLSKKWHIGENSFISAISVQTAPFIKDSIVVSIYIGSTYYEFGANFLDSLASQRKYVTNLNMKTTIEKYVIKVPSVKHSP